MPPHCDSMDGPMMALQRYADGPVPEAREYVEAMLGLEVWAHEVYHAIKAEAHASARGAA